MENLPNSWIDATCGEMRVYHVKDLAVYVNDNDFEVHNMNITKSKFSLLLKANDWQEVLGFVERRAA
jgi:hypothetical protein